jgi:hypothetical protein
VYVQSSETYQQIVPKMRVKYENSKAWWGEEVGEYEMDPFPVHASLQGG